MRLVSRLYRLALRSYPRSFRLRYQEELVRVFGEGLRDARSAGARTTLRYYGLATSDLLAGAMRERLAAVNRLSVGVGLFAIVAGGLATYVDFHASEVQATLLVLITSNLVLGCAAPKGAWRRALLVAALLPAIHVAAYAWGGIRANHGHPYFSRLMIFFPALVASLLGAYLGVFLRFVGRVLAGRLRLRRGSGPGTVA